MTTIQTTDSPHRGDVYARAAWQIFHAGYSPIPLDPATKDEGIPVGYTGYAGRMASGADVQTWIEDCPGHNIAARLPANAAGLDVDAYGDKPAADTLDHLQAEHGPLPSTYRVSSRFGDEYDGVSGIRLYRLPAEYAERATDQAAGWIGGWSGIDIVRHAHRYAVGPPSIHPKRGTPYQVLNESTGEITDEMPPVDSLPMLPAAWCAALVHGDGGRQRKDTAGSEWWTDGKPCPSVQEALGKSVAEMEAGRHDGAAAGVMRLTRLGEQGHQGVHRAIDALRGAFLTAVTSPGEGQRSASQATAEWGRFVIGLDAKLTTSGLTPEHERGCRHGTALDGGDESPGGDDDTRAERKSVATVLVDLALARYRLGITEEGEPFAVPLAGPKLVRQLRGSKGSLRTELAAAYFDKTGRAAPQAALADALAVIEGRCQTCPPEPLALRVAEHHGEYYLDLGDNTGRAIRIGRTGWVVVEDPPVLFRRTELTGVLPEPRRGESLDGLWALLNVHEHARPLLVAWLVMALFVGVPTPVLAFSGEQGTGKSTVTKTVAGFVDPSPAQVRKPPRDPDAWVMMAQGSWVVAVDNLSAISDWFSDALCRAVTGDGDVRRRLYSDSGLAVFRIQRPIVLNGIDLGALRGDLVDRLVVCELDIIQPRSRRTDSEIRRVWEHGHPGYLGALLDVAVKVLAALPTVKLEQVPRMADFAHTLAAVDQVMGTDGFSVYWRQFENLAADSVAGDPVLAAIGQAITDTWEGRAADLLAVITPQDAGWRRPRDWPRDARDLTGILKRNAPAMRRVGWEVEHRQGGHAKVLTWRLTPPGGDPSARGGDSAPATPATPAAEGAGAGTAGDAGIETGPSLSTSTGPCARCHAATTRYGDTATGSLCADCRKESAA